MGSAARTGDAGEDSATLIVDLDADLLGGDLAGEVFWGAMRQDWRRALTGRMRDPSQALLGITHLPYHGPTLERCRAAREAGRRVVLVTSGPSALAEAVAQHLGCFDAAEGGHPARKPMAPARARANDLLRAMRPHQWVKNLLVFLPLIVAHRFDIVTFGWSLLAFLSFGLIASAVYLVNDLIDLPADRRHPSKRNRPFASGRLPLAAGTRTAPMLFVAGLGIAALAGVELFAVMALYALTTTAYSLRLKGTLAADILVLAVLYTLRIIAGAAATGIVPSMWLLSFSIFLFLSLAAVKRLTELVDIAHNGAQRRVAGRAYVIEDRPVVAMIATSAGFLAVLVLALYIDSPDVRGQYGTPEVLWGICLVLLFWVSRTVLLAHRGLVDQDPVIFALTDRASQISGLVTAVLFVTAMLV
jgi:4-hydroxybenzoate polyprenyltransferase